MLIFDCQRIPSTHWTEIITLGYERVLESNSLWIGLVWTWFRFKHSLDTVVQWRQVYVVQWQIIVLCITAWGLWCERAVWWLHFGYNGIQADTAEHWILTLVTGAGAAAITWHSAAAATRIRAVLKCEVPSGTGAWCFVRTKDCPDRTEIGFRSQCVLQQWIRRWNRSTMLLRLGSGNVRTQVHFYFAIVTLHWNLVAISGNLCGNRETHTLCTLCPGHVWTITDL